MTRETKISLLVGLAFIIVIGILLSDYNRNESPTASLPQVVADNVKNSTATLRNGSADSAVVPPPAPVAPTRPLATHDELNPVTHIEVGPSGASPATGNAGNEHGPVRPMTPVTDNTPPAPLPPTPTNGGDLVPYSPHPPIAPPATPSVPTVNGAKAYVAVESDTLNKLAGRFLGANTKANREAIMAINHR